MRNKIDQLSNNRGTGAAQHEQVAHIWQTMQWREAARPEDETLCLARLLGIDPLPLLEITAPDDAGTSKAELAEKRMVVFLDLLDQYVGIPPDMICRFEGLSWAPRSWMCKCSRDLAGPLFIADQRLSFLTRNGLHVQYPDIVLHPGHRMAQAQRQAQAPRFWIPTVRNLTKWYRVEFIADGADGDGASWEEIWECATESTELPAIICSRFDTHDEPELGQLVKGVCRRNEEVHAVVNAGGQSREDCRWVRSLCRVWIQWETDHAIAAKITEEFRYNIDLMTWGESADRGQRWVVDGQRDTEIS